MPNPFVSTSHFHRFFTTISRYPTISSLTMRWCWTINVREPAFFPHMRLDYNFLVIKSFHSDRGQIHGLYAVSYGKELIHVSYLVLDTMYGISRESQFLIQYSCNKKMSYVLFVTFGNVYISEINKVVAINANVDKGWLGSFYWSTFLIVYFLFLYNFGAGDLETIQTCSPFSNLVLRLEGWYWCLDKFVSLFVFIIITKYYYVYFFSFCRWRRLVSREVFLKHL